MEHGDLLGAWRSKVLEQQRHALLVEVTARLASIFATYRSVSTRGIDPIDRQARHRAINDESDVSCGSVVLRWTA